MNRDLSIWVLAATLLAASPALADQTAEPETSPFTDLKKTEDLRRALERRLEKPAGKTGAHRPSDPHAALDPQRLIQVALQHQAEGRPHLALDTLFDALRRFPDNGDLLAVRGSLLLQQDRTAEALRDLEAAARATPDNAAIYVNRAQAFRRFGDLGKALADLDRAVQLNPDSVAARFNRGSMHFNASRFELALADFDHCVAVDPHAPPPYFNLAMTREQLGDISGAVADLKRFLELADTPAWREIAEKKLAELAALAATGEGRE